MTHRAPVEIAPYDPAWPERFRAARSELFAVFAPAAVRVEHVGSTAVPGLAAKPIVDVLLGAERLADVEARIPALVARGWEYHPEHEAVLPERRFLAFPRERPRHLHLHAVERSSAFFEDHLLFRDLLRREPATARRYAALKRELAARFGDDREGYTEAKAEFVRAALARARAERDALRARAARGLPAQVRLRPACEADRAWLFALLEECLGPYVEQTFGVWDDAEQRERFARSTDPRTHRVVLWDGVPVGCLYVTEDEASVHLHRVFVRPEHQGRGLGGALVRDVLEDARRRGRPVRLRVFRVNPAQRLYGRLGFREVGETDTHVLMEAPVPPGP